MSSIKFARRYPSVNVGEKTGKRPIGVKWVGINKGDEANPEYRSRLLAKEINKDTGGSVLQPRHPWKR